MALVKAGADLKAADRHGMTALASARAQDHTDVVAILRAADATK
jgi:hypothetical protein